MQIGGRDVDLVMVPHTAKKKKKKKIYTNRCRLVR